MLFYLMKSEEVLFVVTVDANEGRYGRHENYFKNFDCCLHETPGDCVRVIMCVCVCVRVIMCVCVCV